MLFASKEKGQGLLEALVLFAILGILIIMYKEAFK